MIELPDKWQLLHWKQKVALAKQINEANGVESDEKMEASQANAVIDAESRRQANAARIPEAADPVVEPTSEAGVPLKLLHDTWQGETRINADGRVTVWPLAEAKRLIAAGVAERADPLPGE